MKFAEPQSLATIAELIDAKIIGNTSLKVLGTNEIHRIENGEIVFVDHPKYYDKALHSNASVILINKEVEAPEGKALLVVEEPFTAFNKINLAFRPREFWQERISSTAKIGNKTVIAPTAFVGNHVKIGKNCFIHPNVSIGDFTEIGDEVIIHSGTVLGGDAFYYKNRGDHFEKLESVGKVIIENNVEIGANCTIDRGVTAETRIGAHSKLDNLIQIGHDTIVGQRCLIASQVGIAGCCTIGNNVTMWGQVGVKADIIIEDDVEIYAQSGIIHNLKKGKTYFGSPAKEAREMFKIMSKLYRL